MRVLLFAPSVRYAMRHYIEEITLALQSHVEVVLLVPEHFLPSNLNVKIVTFKSGGTGKALLRNISPFTIADILLKIKRVNPDVLHILNSEGYPWSLAVTTFTRLMSIPTVVTVHDPEPHPGAFFDFLASKLRVISLRNADIIHLHYSDNNLLKHNKYIEKKAIILPHIDIAQRFYQYVDDSVDKEDAVLFFGRQEKYKGLDVLVKASENVVAGVKIIVAGPGKISDSLVSYMGTHADRFEIINRYLSDREVAQLFQRSKVLVLPYTQATQSSLPKIAARFGLRIVATATGVFVEEVPRLGGIVVEPCNANLLSCAINQALEGKNNSNEVEVAGDKFIVEKLVSIYQKISVR